MSEFLAEARILVRPDTTKFRAELEAALSVATKPITIPVVPVMTGGFSAATSQTAAFTTAQAGAAAQTEATTAAIRAQALADKELAAAQAAQVRTLSGVAKGAASSGLTLFGLRGATLAASGAFLAGTAAVVAFSKSLQSAASLETELNVFKAAAGATADEMARVSAEARALGKDLTLPGVTANDAAVALTELTKAGLSVQDSLDGARGALQLATAAQIDNVTATKLVAGALNAFNLAGTDAVKVADLLTGAAKESQGEIGDMGTALSQVAAVSNQFGVSIADTVTLLTELAQAGLSGGRAGTSLRVAFLRLVNPTADAAKELDKLNIAVRDANGNLRPGVFTDIKDALEGYTKAQQDATLATIFGSDAIRAAAIIGNKGTLAFLQTSAAINEVGLAQEQAAARTSGLQGSFENLNNQVSALGLALGEVAKGPMTSFVNGLADIAKGAGDTATNLVSVGTKIKGFTEDVDRSVPILGSFDSHLGDIGKAGFLLNPLTGQFKAIAEGAKLLGDNSEEAAPKTDRYGNSIEGVGADLSDLSAKLLQSAADSRAFTAQVTSDTAALLQSAADSRIDFSKLGQVPDPGKKPFNVQRVENIVRGFDAQEVRDRIAGDNTQLVADLNAEQAFLLQQLQNSGVQRRPALKRALEQSLLGVVNDLNAIQDQAAQAAKAAKAKAEQTARELEAAARAAAEAAARAAADILRLRNSRLDLAIQRAGLTKGTGDDKTAINAAIKRFQQDIDGLNRIKNKTVEQQQAVVDLTSKIYSLQASLKGLQSTQSGGSFTIGDLFKEAVNNFQTFGSNIAGRAGVLSAQDTRGQLGGNILAQLGKEQLTESQKQTLLLTSIDKKVGGTAPASGRGPSRTPSYGELQGLRGAAMAAAYGYGG